MKILKSAQIQEIDDRTIKETGIPSIVLMENAGRMSVELIIKQYRSHQRFCVIAGPGNNGGDGLVIARHLANLGKQVKVYVLAESSEYTSADLKTNISIFENMYMNTTFINEHNARALLTDLNENDLLIDCIFGTGFKPPAIGYRKQVIEHIKKLNNTIVSIDLPSGLSADTGSIQGSAIKANLTISFGYPKLAHLLHPAASYCGQIYVADISLDKKYATTIENYLIEPKELKLPERLTQSHKNTYGHIGIIGGSTGLSGAIILAAQAASKTGAGLITTIIPECINKVVKHHLIEEMSSPQQDNGTTFSAEAIPIILKTIKQTKFSSLLIGNGMGIEDHLPELIQKILEFEMPIILDADAINNLVKIENWGDILFRRTQTTILTPHIGEAARLLNMNKEEILSDIILHSKNLAKSTNSYIVLKGPTTIIATPWELVYFSNKGNPGMATAGTGDVLAGIIAALLCRLSPQDALRLGVYLHGISGDIATLNNGQESIIASDLTKNIPKAYQVIQQMQMQPNSSITKI